MPSLKVHKDIVVGETMVIGDRSLLPVSQTVVIYASDGNIAGAWISPLALVIADPIGEYCADLTGQGLTMDKLIEISPGLSEAIKQAREERSL